MHLQLVYPYVRWLLKRMIKCERRLQLDALGHTASFVGLYIHSTLHRDSCGNFFYKFLKKNEKLLVLKTETDGHFSLPHFFYFLVFFVFLKLKWMNNFLMEMVCKFKFSLLYLYWAVDWWIIIAIILKIYRKKRNYAFMFIHILMFLQHFVLKFFSMFVKKWDSNGFYDTFEDGCAGWTFFFFLLLLNNLCLLHI